MATKSLRRAPCFSLPVSGTPPKSSVGELVFRDVKDQNSNGDFATWIISMAEDESKVGLISVLKSSKVVFPALEDPWNLVADP